MTGLIVVLRVVAVLFWLSVQLCVSTIQFFGVVPWVLFAMFFGYRNPAVFKPWVVPRFWSTAPSVTPVLLPARQTARVIHQHQLTITGPPAPEMTTCEHCASTIPANTACPNCGASPNQKAPTS